MLKESYPYYLANEECRPNSKLEVIDKYSGDVVTRVALADDVAIDKAIDAAVAAQKAMQQLAPMRSPLPKYTPASTPYASTFTVPRKCFRNSFGPSRLRLS